MIFLTIQAKYRRLRPTFLRFSLLPSLQEPPGPWTEGVLASADRRASVLTAVAFNNSRASVQQGWQEKQEYQSKDIHHVSWWTDDYWIDYPAIYRGWRGGL